MSRHKHHARSHRHGHGQGAGATRARGLLARVLDRIRAWFGDRESIRRLRRETGPMSESMQAGGAFAVGGGRRHDQPRASRRGAARGRYPIGYVPGPQPWPWRFTGHGVPWAPGPESYSPQFRGPLGGPQGRFAGRGPRNYVRADERIIEDIHEVLTYSPQVDASDIEIRVDRGEVTVRGTVDDRYTRRLVEDLIHDVPGVRDLQNQLRVQRRDLQGPGGLSRAHAGDEFHRAHRDITAGHDLDDLESSSLNTGDERCQPEDARRASTTSR